MARYDGPNYFIVKHNLRAFEALPNFIWHTDVPKNRLARGYGQVKEGDRWIGFAYTDSDRRERRTSLVTGFFECTKEARYGDVPRRAGESRAWMIEGRSFGRPLRDAVVILPIGSFLNKRMYDQNAITRISKKIACLGREPRSEQEVLAVVASGHRKIGIEKIVRIRTAFPDMLVKIKGKAEEVHLELEMYSSGFMAHGHYKQVDKKGRFSEETGEKDDKRPVAVLCWVDDDKHRTLKPYVHRVYELQSLLRQGRRIRW